MLDIIKVFHIIFSTLVGGYIAYQMFDIIKYVDDMEGKLKIMQTMLLALILITLLWI